jgi:transcriptional regulator with XRE-family HTH domain
MAIQSLGSRIRQLRTEKGLGQDRLAVLAHVDQSGLSKLERGSRGLGEVAVRRVAGVLGIEYEVLIAGTDFEE